MKEANKQTHVDNLEFQAKAACQATNFEEQCCSTSWVLHGLLNAFTVRMHDLCYAGSSLEIKGSPGVLHLRAPRETQCDWGIQIILEEDIRTYSCNPQQNPKTFSESIIMGSFFFFFFFLKYINIFFFSHKDPQPFTHFIFESIIKSLF